MESTSRAYGLTVVSCAFFSSARACASPTSRFCSGIGSAEVTAYDLPDEIGEKLLEMMRRMELRFGAAKDQKRVRISRTDGRPAS